MMAKRRTSKRRTTDAAELAAWADVFRCGYDYFGDLESRGLTGNARLGSAEAQKARRAYVEEERAAGRLAIRHTPPEECEQDAAIYNAASAAWRDLGEAFMASWTPRQADSTPWALEAFGRPWEAHRAR
jgi:hypothetical protein